MTENKRNKNKGFIYWLRWLSVLPVSIVAGIVALFPLHWILLATLSSFIEPYPELPERLLVPFVVSGVFVWTGSRIAPEYRFGTSIVLLGLWMFMVGGFVFLTISGDSWMGQQLYFMGGGTGSVMAVVGAFVGLHFARRSMVIERDKIKGAEQ